MACFGAQASQETARLVLQVDAAISAFMAGQSSGVQVLVAPLRPTRRCRARAAHAVRRVRSGSAVVSNAHCYPGRAHASFRALCGGIFCGGQCLDRRIPAAAARRIPKPLRISWSRFGVTGGGAAYQIVTCAVKQSMRRSWACHGSAPKPLLQTTADGECRAIHATVFDHRQAPTMHCAAAV